ncbi:HAD family hydrolase, partial [Streptomyces sp. NPDC048057]|uniref:HAD family hydrolase n=1 Tax=Streptomyces sp. NPDC048057 TaxID=3155628 RepID=UPI0033DA6917
TCWETSPRGSEGGRKEKDLHTAGTSPGGLPCVWDWNGTLFDDADALIASTIDAFAFLGLPPLTPDRYRELHTQPIDTFYDRLLGRTVPPALRSQLHAAFQDAYVRRRSGIGLAPDALAALHAVEQAGRTQSVLSMHPHDALSALIDRFALRPHLARVDGQQGADAGYKRDHLTAHLRALDRPPGSAVLIGDSVDDARAAKAVGVRCVLYASGLHAPDTLRAEGVPVVHTLEDALATALPPVS